MVSIEIYLQWFFKIANALLAFSVFAVNLRFLVKSGLRGKNILEMNFVLLYVVSGLFQFMLSVVFVHRLFVYGPSMVGYVWDDLGRTSTFLLLTSILTESIRRGLLWKN